MQTSKWTIKRKQHLRGTRDKKNENSEKNKRIERLKEIKKYDFTHKSKPVKVLQADLKEIIDSQRLISAGWLFQS